MGDVCLSFHDVCRFSRVVGYEPNKDLAYFVDARVQLTLDLCKRAIYDYLVGYFHNDCTTLYHMPAKFIAGGFLAIFDEMAVQCESRKPNRDVTILKEKADSTPVLLLQKLGDRQYFYVPGRYDAKLIPTTVNAWRRDEKNEPVKQFSYLGSSYYSAPNLSQSRRFMDIRYLIFKKIGEKHPGWNMEAFAMAKTEKERWEELGPPPTVPHKRT